MSSEASIQAQILIAWSSHPRVRLWRSNAGQAWAPDGRGGFRPIVLSVKGTPDLVGVIQREINGERVAQYFGVECKVPGTATRSATHLSPDQRLFHAWMKEFGGIVVVARCVEDVDAALAPLGVFRV